MIRVLRPKPLDLPLCILMPGRWPFTGTGLSARSDGMCVLKHHDTFRQGNALRAGNLIQTSPVSIG